MNDYEIYPERNYHETVHRYAESPMDPHQMDCFYTYTDIEPLQDAINPSYSITAEEKEIYKKALLILTIKQRLILDTYLATGNQKLTAKICKIGQPAVSIALNGIRIYKGRHAGKKYGGIIPKIMKYVANYPRNQQIRSRYKAGELKEDLIKEYKITHKKLNRILMET